MRRRIRRVRLNPGPFIVLGLFANLAAGVAFSPLTAVRRVRIEGAPVADRERLTKILQVLKGVPCARVDARSIESQALQNSELRGATLARTPFGIAVLRVARRLPVARLYARPDAGLSEEGVLFAATELPPDLPQVNLAADFPRVGLTLGNGWRAADVAHLATLVRGLGASDPPRIDVESGGRVCLNIDSGRVDLGRCADLDAKVARLRSILRDRPELFATVLKLDLVNLDAPTFVPRPVPPSQHAPGASRP